MKILMLTWEYPPRIVGGIARVVHDLSKRLIKDGHDVYVVTYKEGNVPYFEDDKGVKVYRVDNYMINPNNFIDWIMQLNFNMITKANELINEYSVHLIDSKTISSKQGKDVFYKVIEENKDAEESKKAETNARAYFLMSQNWFNL